METKESHSETLKTGWTHSRIFISSSCRWLLHCKGTTIVMNEVLHRLKKQFKHPNTESRSLTRHTFSKGWLKLCPKTRDWRPSGSSACSKLWLKCRPKLSDWSATPRLTFCQACWVLSLLNRFILQRQIIQKNQRIVKTSWNMEI